MQLLAVWCKAELRWERQELHEMSASMMERVVNGVLIAVTSFILWLASRSLHESYFSEVQFAMGIDLFHIPSGIRLLLLLIGGVAAATGIALANLLSVEAELGIGGSAQIVLASFYTAFATLFSLWLTLRIMGVDRDLKVLVPRHLPWICLGTAVGSSMFHNVFFSAIAPVPLASLALNTLAMIAGDFLGSLAVVGLLWGAIRLIRRVF